MRLTKQDIINALLEFSISTAIGVVIFTFLFIVGFLMKTCKHCGEPISVKTSGLRNFSSFNCKHAYRKEYLKQKKQQERLKLVNNNDGYVNTNPDMSTIPGAFKQTIDTKNRLNQEDLKVAKGCCNYEVKQVTGYCITLYEPYYGFRITAGIVIYSML